jgi:hypothetical protein
MEITMLKTVLGLAVTAGFLLSTTSAQAQRVFIGSARVEASGEAATFPTYRGVTSDGRSVTYMVLDASTSEAAQRYRVNRSNKLANAKNSAAVQKVKMQGGVIVFPATVDFAPERVVVPGAGGFPPTAFQPGAVGEPGYSPLIQLPDGTIINAPHIANGSGQADKVLSLGNNTVRYGLTPGFANDKRVLYVSTDASDPLAASLEGVTLAPQLGFAPGQGDDSSDSSRAILGATINGQLGANNPNRQGFNSALLEGLAPLNALAWTPNQGRYSPLWDVNLGLWTAAAISGRRNVVLKDTDDFFDAAEDRLLTAPDGSAFGAIGIVVNCPVVKELD